MGKTEAMKKNDIRIIRKRRALMDILARLPDDIGRSLRGLPDRVLDGLEEIRFRTDRPVIVYSSGSEYEVARMGDRNVSQAEIEKIFSLLVHHSNYSYQEEIKSGYVTLEGGHRVGICGKVVSDNGCVVAVKDISSINIRRGSEFPGISDELIPFIVSGKKQIRNTLIVSPPKCGKTTVLRDAIRNLSNSGYKVGVCDERSEIAGAAQGIPGFDVGMRTDVLDGCPKNIGIDMLIRSMSPDIIAVDELGTDADAAAVERVTVAGISLIATMHGDSYEDVIRSRMGKCVKAGLISRIILLGQEPVPGTIKAVYTAAKVNLIEDSSMNLKWTREEKEVDK